MCGSYLKGYSSKFTSLKNAKFEVNWFYNVQNISTLVKVGNGLNQVNYKHNGTTLQTLQSSSLLFTG